MAYRFNGGKGGVTCDICNVLIDENISFKDYLRLYRKTHPEEDICWSCKSVADKGRKNKKSQKKHKKAK